MSSPFSPPLSADEISSLFPEFTTINIIKSGGEGTVVKVTYTCGDSTALKIYGPTHLKARTELEAKKLKCIDSPYLVKLYKNNSVTIRGLDCYYTETSFVEGKDLKTLLDIGYKFTERDVINLLKCISLAIDSLWEQRVVHCDIKPENIIKRGDDYILIDLGIAKYLDENTMTQAGMIMGTYGYIAPEHLNGRKNLTQKADYYTLGITAFEILANYHPYNNNQFAMFNNPVPDLPDNIEISLNVKNLIRKMMNLVPYLRPSTYKQIINELQEAR